MKKIFFGGPIRNVKDQAYVDTVVSALTDCGFSVFLPARDIGLLDKDTNDLQHLQENLDAVKRCDVAVFLLENEGTGTGIELGYLYCLKELGQTQTQLFGLCRLQNRDEIDLMARYCLATSGRLFWSIEELVDAVSADVNSEE